ncbi:ring box protein 1 family protein [Cardiosporidium cionae]|uniref:Ring box protein 1 family protein n=1 Tax=Cardiosporidium cionae TaxID=476202 RepID=A0ABQ7J5S3_9APIC|nr:ring box protein 1 family protein [Cardiosporidium cionae]|eukprot:KAF8819324.1 ring box protein 1 family protein [Cardiosporidium cionae]
MSRDAAEPDAPKRFTIKAWSAVGLWSWDIKTDNCSICRNFIMEPCIDCQTNEVEPENRTSDSCPTVTGACNHSFHEHCIKRWLERRYTCPLDNNPWQSKQSS